LVLGVVVVIAAVVAIVVWYSRTHQGIELPADGSPLPTSKPVMPPDRPGVSISTVYAQQGANQRRATIVAPSDVAPGEKLPVVVLLHGHSGNSGVVLANGDWYSAVTAYRFVVVAPDGVAQSWNAGGCCRLATTLGIDDDTYLDVLVRDTKRREFVDPTRVFMVGESNGGMMAYRFACRHGGEIDGMVSVEGTRLDRCAPKRPIPVLQVHGTDDRVVPYRGGESAAGALLSRTSFPPVEPSMALLARQLGCNPTPTIDHAVSAVTTRAWGDCAGGARVQLDTIAGLDHVWPRGSPYNATERIVAFLGLTG